MTITIPTKRHPIIASVNWRQTNREGKRFYRPVFRRTPALGGWFFIAPFIFIYA